MFGAVAFPKSYDCCMFKFLMGTDGAKRAVALDCLVSNESSGSGTVQSATSKACVAATTACDERAARAQWRCHRCSSR